MILKDYQAQAIRNLEDFLKLLDENKTISEAFKNFWASHDVNPIAVSQNKVPFQSMQYMRNYKQDHLV